MHLILIHARLRQKNQLSVTQIRTPSCTILPIRSYITHLNCEFKNLETLKKAISIGAVLNELYSS